MFNYLFLLAHAAETTLSSSSINPNIPGVTGNNPVEMIGGLYRFALAISGFLAIAVIVYGAIKYATNSGNAGNLADAKEWIYSALLGILLLAGAYILLYTIGGTQLTNLRLPGLQQIDIPTTTPNLFTTYAVVEQEIIGKYPNQTSCTSSCGEFGGTTCRPLSGSEWACVKNKPLPNIQCSRTTDDCTAKKLQLSAQNPDKFYDCVQVNADRSTWCSTSGLGPLPTAENCATGKCVKIDFSGWQIKNGSAVDPKMYDVLSCIAGSGFPLRVTEAMPPTVVHSSVRHNNGCAIDATLPGMGPDDHPTAADCSKVCELGQVATFCGSAKFLNEYYKLCGGSAACKGTNTEHATNDHVHIEANCGK